MRGWASDTSSVVRLVISVASATLSQNDDQQGSDGTDDTESSESIVGLLLGTVRRSRRFGIYRRVDLERGDDAGVIGRPESN